METIFDHNPTETELRRFGIKAENGDIDKQIEWMKKINKNSKHDNLYQLYILFSIRGDKKRADEIYPQLWEGHKNILIQDF